MSPKLKQKKLFFIFLVFLFFSAVSDAASAITFSFNLYDASMNLTRYTTALLNETVASVLTDRGFVVLSANNGISPLTIAAPSCTPKKSFFNFSSNIIINPNNSSSNAVLNNHTLFLGGKCVPCDPCERRFRLTWCSGIEDTVCVDVCPPGTYRHNGGSTSVYSLGSCDPCTDRGNFYYSALAGQTACSKCAVGSLSNGTNCIACPNGTSSTSGVCLKVPLFHNNNTIFRAFVAHSFLWLLLV